MTAPRPQLRRASAIVWTFNNPVLLAGEVGVLKPGFKKFKIGDGITAWNDLAYYQTADLILAAADLRYAAIDAEWSASDITSGQFDIERLGYDLDDPADNYTLLNGYGEWARVAFRPLATADRPAVGDVYDGAAYFDTTLGKPAWSNGTDWVDATGTAI